MSIVSGRTRIIFDGKYCISEKTNKNGESFKVMTFNQSGNIKYKPDTDYVTYSDDYFPGTMISAKLLLNEDDITNSIFDAGINLYVDKKFNDFITNKIIDCKTKIIKILFSYSGE